MRLAQDQVHAIKSVAQRVLGGDARVILFGSRTDDAQRGGDIDCCLKRRTAWVTAQQRWGNFMRP